MVAKQSNEQATSYLAVLTYEPCAENVFAWVARHADLPGCMSDGETPEAALANLADARSLYIEDLVERGMPVPNPGSSAAAQLILEALGEGSRPS